MVFRQLVNSGAVASPGYVPPIASLEVEFKDGQVWRYSPFSPAQFHEMLIAPSIGEYFNRNVREVARFRVRVA